MNLNDFYNQSTVYWYKGSFNIKPSWYFANMHYYDVNLFRYQILSIAQWKWHFEYIVAVIFTP